jgi:nucleotide-binding universal stress UspA family protein
MAQSKVIVGYESTAEGHDALELGRTLCRMTGASLIVASVWPRTAPGSYRRNHADHLGSLASAHLQDVDLAIDGRCLEAPTAVAGLKRLAAEEHAKAVVVGSTHRGVVRRMLPGSVGSRLLAQAPCAVAIAPRGYGGERWPDSDRRHPLSSEMRGSDDGIPRVIGVAFDGYPESHLALRLATELAQGARAALRIITVGTWGVKPGTADRGDPRSHGELQDLLHRSVATLPASVRAEPVYVRGLPGPELVAMAERGIGLMVMGSRSRGVIKPPVCLGSVSRQVIREASCPVLVTPRGIESSPGTAAARGAAPVGADGVG